MAKSAAYCRDRGHAPLRQLLWPRHRAFVALVRRLQAQHIGDCVYDVTLCYTQRGRRCEPSIVELFVRHAAPLCMHVHVRRYAFDALPSDDAELAAWLEERYREKDAMLEYFDAHGAFPAWSDASRAATVQDAMQDRGAEVNYCWDRTLPLAALWVLLLAGVYGTLRTIASC